MSADSNLYSAFFARARAEAPLLTDAAGRCYSYGDAEREAGRVAAWLAGLGLAPGERVTVQAPKSPEWLWLYLGCLRQGAVFHPLNEAYEAEELAYFLADARPAVAICDPLKAHIYQGLTTTSSTKIFSLDASGAGSLSEALPPAPAAVSPRPCASEELAVLLYSSGTTGQPKGVMITHGNLLSNARTLVAAWEFRATDRLLHFLPVYHAHGLFVAIGCTLLSGASMAFLPRFEPAEVLRQLPACTVVMGVPTHYTRLLAAPGFQSADLARVRVFISGSAPLLPATFAAFEAHTGQRILERYGMTETGMNSANPLHGERRAGTVGRPLPGVEIRVTDTDGRPLPAGEPGEVEVRGPNVFAGYWQRPEQTAEAFTPDGFFRTGDQGSFSADGYLTLSGRSKDLIITGGLNVYPAEVELALDALPGVSESAVVGAPHPDFGEGVVAFVVAEPGVRLQAAELRAALRGRLAKFKLPKQILFVSELPRNAMGKVQKTVLRERVRASFGPGE